MKIRATDVGRRNFDQNIGRLFNLCIRHIIDHDITRTFINHSFHLAFPLRRRARQESKTPPANAGG
jgi:hypothetical protein